MSAFALQDGVVHHTYSSYASGVEQLMGTFGYLDVAPLGRNEDPQNPGAWWAPPTSTRVTDAGRSGCHVLGRDEARRKLGGSGVRPGRLRRRLGGRQDAWDPDRPPDQGVAAWQGPRSVS